MVLFRRLGTGGKGGTMKYRKMWEILMRRAMKMAEGNEKWIGERFLEEMDAAEYEYHETLVMKDLAEGITRAEEQKGEKKDDII